MDPIIAAFFLKKFFNFARNSDTEREIHSLSAISHMLRGKQKSKLTAYTRVLPNKIELTKKSYGHTPAEGEERAWLLNFAEQKFPVTLKVIEIRESIVTAEFINPPQDLIETIRRDAIATELAAGLGIFSVDLNSTKIEGLNSSSVREIDSKVLAHRHEGTPHWYKFDDRAELFMIEDNVDVIYFYIALEDWCLEYFQSGELALSKVNRTSDIKLQKEKDLLAFSDEDKIPAIRMSIYFINHAEVIKPALRRLMLSRLSSHLRKLSP